MNKEKLTEEMIKEELKSKMDEKFEELSATDLENVAGGWREGGKSPNGKWDIVWLRYTMGSDDEDTQMLRYITRTYCCPLCHNDMSLGRRAWYDWICYNCAKEFMIENADII